MKKLNEPAHRQPIHPDEADQRALREQPLRPKVGANAPKKPAAKVTEDAEGYLHPTDKPGDMPDISAEHTMSGLTPESSRKRI